MRRGLLVGLALLAGLGAMIRFFPLAWAGHALPDGLGTYSGTVWQGQVRQVPLLGVVNVKGSLLGANLQTLPGEVTLSGDVSPKGVKDLILSMPVSRLPTSDARLAGLGGRLSLQIDEAVIEDGVCMSATGQASTDVLAVNESQFQWAGPALSGPIDCVDGRLRVQLNGEDRRQSVSVNVTTGLDGVYQTQIEVSTTDPSAANVLSLFGFSSAEPGRYTLSEQGRWR